MSQAQKNDSPSPGFKVAAAAIIGIVLIGAALFFVFATLNRAGGQPGFLGTRASLFADINLIAEIILLIGLMVGYGFARQGNIPAHQYNQTGWVLFNIVLTLFIMAVAFNRQVIPGLPDNLRGAFGLTSTIHAALGTITILFAVYILLRMNKLLPKALRISWWKNLMRITLGMYWLVGLFGIATYYIWYVQERPAVAVPTPEPGTTAQPVAAGGKVVLPMANYEFVPPEITIPVGATIVFQNADPDAHTVTFDNDEFPAFGFQEGDTHEILFDKVGDFQFYCEFHGSPGRKGMSGVIHVAPAEQVAVVPTSVPIPTATAIPTPVSLEVQALSVIGVGQFRDARAHNDEFRLTLSNLPTGLSGDFTVWLLNDDNSAPLRLGTFVADANNAADFVYADANGANLLEAYSGFEVTLEAVGSSPAQPSTDVVFGGRIPADSVTAIRQLLAKSETAPENKGYAVGLLGQVQELLRHTTEMNNAAQAGDVASLNRHVEHAVAIIVGKDNPDRIDFEGDGFVTDPGDGFGIINYTKAIDIQADVAGNAPNATPNIKTQAANVKVASNAVRELASQIAGFAFDVHGANSDADRKAIAENALKASQRLLSGFDNNANGALEPTAEESGAFTVYFHSQFMAAIGALNPQDFASLPIIVPPTPVIEVTPPPGATATNTPEPPTATPEPTAGPVTVVFRNFEIVPNVLTIPAGTQVVFKILDSQHEVYQSFPGDNIDIAGFDSGPLNPGAEFKITFNNPNTITIRCGFHPKKMVMTLTISP
jgi:plastocyanin/uncharacterized membrane protein YozB (DUF420 family)